METHVLVVSQRWYQEFKRAANDPHAAMHLLLVQACLDVIKDAQQGEQDPEVLVVKALDRLGEGIAQTLSGGWCEFRNYMPEGRPAKVGPPRNLVEPDFSEHPKV